MSSIILNTDKVRLVKGSMTHGPKGRTVGTIAKAAGMPKSTVIRYLWAMKVRHLVIRTEKPAPGAPGKICTWRLA